MSKYSLNEYTEIRLGFINVTICAFNNLYRRPNFFLGDFFNWTSDWFSLSTKNGYQQSIDCCILSMLKFKLITIRDPLRIKFESQTEVMMSQRLMQYSCRWVASISANTVFFATIIMIEIL